MELKLTGREFLAVVDKCSEEGMGPFRLAQKVGRELYGREPSAVETRFIRETYQKLTGEPISRAKEK